MELNGGPDVAPFVITYRKVFKRPKIELVRTFVGIRKFLSNLVGKAREVFEEIAYDEQKNVIDPGESKAVHWAINVRDPWDSAGEADLIAFQVTGLRPPAGFHFEVVQVVEHQPPTSIEPRNGTHTHSSPAAADRIRQSLNESARNYGTTEPYDTGEDTGEDTKAAT